MKEPQELEYMQFTMKDVSLTYGIAAVLFTIPIVGWILAIPYFILVHSIIAVNKKNRYMKDSYDYALYKRGMLKK